MNVKWIKIISIAGGALSLVIAIFTFNVIATILAGLFFMISLIVWKYGYIFMPMITKTANLENQYGEYTVPPKQNCILKKTKDDYYATMFLGANITKTTGDNKESKILSEQFEKIVTSVKYVTKFSMMVRNIDLGKHLDSIKAKRSNLETRKAQLLSSNPTKHSGDIARIDREIVMWNRQLDKLSNGELPLETVFYIQTTAKSPSKENAIQKVTNQAKELKTLISSSMNMSCYNLTGEDMLKCFEWERFIPTNDTEFVDMVD